MRFPFALLLLSSTAFAGEFKETVAPADREAIVKAIQGNLPPVDKAAVAKCQPKLDEYNKDPDKNFENLFDVAGCYKAAGSLGAAVTTYNSYVKETKNEKQKTEAVRILSKVYETAGMFAEAAEASERFASTYPKEKDAKERLVRATCIRRQLGDDDLAKKDGLTLEAQFKTKAGPALCAKVKPIAMPAKKS